MSGTLPSSPDDPEDEGSDGSDRAPEGTSGARADETSGTRPDGGTADPDAASPNRPATSERTASSASTDVEPSPDAESSTVNADPSPVGADPTATERGAVERDDHAGQIDDVDGDAGDTTDESVRVCWIDDESADDLIGALAPGTARTILGAVHEEPRTASELADAADTSVQNVRHHVSKLTDAGLVQSVDTRYSVKGREMTVYGPADDRVVVAVGGESERSSLLDSLRGLLSAVAVLAGASLLVQALFGSEVATLSGPETVPRIGDAVGATGGATIGTVSPGLAFLAGGLLVLATLVAVDRVRTR
ncbi:helix-turn-helix domain-containing protein [Halobaculum sp. WSA2]|uniref:Helix-turn-helix domain-containing protein n=1 Tax=Halobaculum saliterrae TaxID=2073113 RepID=A0A6B0T0M8_9EURY|nr:winged helix-turn-helix domain-containing protein [Halobaculum saliterrae]MXR42192.1 helix-turn-helix domain-containing protein [Halobaculum saliterrae]